MMPSCYILFVPLLLCLTYSLEASACEAGKQPCEPGLMLPVWKPVDNVSTGQKIGRAFVYFIVLMYIFLGKSIVCDKFAESIEHITSKQRVVKMKKITGEEYIVLVKVWNETVASLTLIALGSSAPEILISVIEICGNGFKAGELGPGSIVGSAAFNLFLIVPICVWAVPSKEIRRVKNMDVFWVTAIWSVFAYIWLYLIVSVSSAGEIDLAEAVITLLFFPLLVISSYIVDKKYINQIYYRYFGRSKKVADVDKMQLEDYNTELKEYEKQRNEYLQTFKQLREKYPEASIEAVIESAVKETVYKRPKSHAYYRSQGIKKFTGSGGDELNRRRRSTVSMRRLENSNTPSRENLDLPPTLKFEKFLYICMTDVGTVVLTVLCDWHGLNGMTLQVDYNTVDGTAVADRDYRYSEGSLTFEPNDKQMAIKIEIMHETEYKPDKTFMVVLSNARAAAKDGSPSKCTLMDPTSATVLAISHAHCGAFGFEHEQFEVDESNGSVVLKVLRTRGCKGACTIPFKTVSGTAIENEDFEGQTGHLEFKDGQLESQITIKILQDNKYELSEYFYVELEHPLSEDFAGRYNPRDPHMVLEEANEDDGRPDLDKIHRCKIIIKESLEMNGVVNKMVANVKLSLKVGASSWKEQFEEAFTVSADSEDEDAKPTKFDYVMHVLSFPWKLLFACIPPNVYWGGWLAFLVSLSFIGLLTTLVIDVAEHFGCTIGLDNMILAITFIAMGTSLPDVYASKVSALHDDTADTSIANVNGSNGVNVFLGIGVAWTIATIYHKINGTKFDVEPGSLAFNVTLFCVEAVVALIFMQFRRYHKSILGELGGPMKYKIITVACFGFFWVFYILLSSLQVYCYIPGF